MSTSTNATRLFHLSGSEGVKISKQIVSLHLSAPLLNLIQLTFEFPVHVSCNCAIVETLLQIWMTKQMNQNYDKSFKLFKIKS